MTVLSYSSRLDPKVLDAITVGAARRALVDDLVRAMSDELARNRHQHRLLVGPRGIGKTHTLALVRERLESGPGTSPKVAVLAPPEELVVRGPEDVPVRLLEQLATWLRSVPEGHVAARKTVELALAKLARERDAGATLELAFGALDEAAAELGRLLVGMIENLDLLLFTGRDPHWQAAAERPHWALRDHLQRAKHLVLLAATPPYSEPLRAADSPYYGLFATTRLEPLGADDMVALFRERLEAEWRDEGQSAEIRRRLALIRADLPRREAQLRALVVFTGGLPRFGHLLFDVLVRSELRDVVPVLSRFLDDQTPYFQARLDPRLVGRGEIEVLEALATALEAQTAAEIAERLRARRPNEVSVALGRLKGLGLVDSGADGRKGAWDLTEPLYRVWRRFRGGRTQRDQLAALAEFLRAMFEPAELLAEKMALEREDPDGLRVALLDVALETGRQDTLRVGRPPGNRTSGSADDQGELARLWIAAEREYLTRSVSEARRLFEMYVDQARATGDTELLARGLVRLSEARVASGSPRDALPSTDEALDLARSLGDHALEARALLCQGRVLFHLGRNEDAMRALDTSERRFVAVGEFLSQAVALLGIGRVYVRLGRIDDALHAFTRAEALYVDANSKLGRANALASQGDVHFRVGRHEEAVRAFGEAEKIYIAVGNRLGQANVLYGQGKIRFAHGESEEALRLFAEADRTYEEVGHPLGRANVLHMQGQVQFHRGRVDEAIAAYCKVEQLSAELGDSLGRANAVLDRGEAYLHLGRTAEALRDIAEAENLYITVGSVVGRGDALVAMGSVHARMERYDEAIHAFTEAELRYVAAGTTLGRANVACWQGQVRARLHLHDEAMRFFDEAERLYVAAGVPLTAGAVAGERGRVQIARGRYAEGLALFFQCAAHEQKHEAQVNLSVTRSDIAAALVAILDAGAAAADAARPFLSQYVDLVAPLLADSDDDRSALSRVAAAAARALRPREAMETLSAMEPILPDPWRDLLRPARLAAEVRAKRRPKSLPGESIEVRRAVRFVLDPKGAAKEPLR